MKPAWTAILPILFLTGSGCSLSKLSVDQMAGVLDTGKVAMETGDDPELVGAALPAQIIMIEGMLQSSPENETLLALLSQAYGNYAFGFVESRMEKLAEDDPEESDRLRKRARGLYLKGLDYGLRFLAEHDDRFPKVFHSHQKELKAAIADLDDDAVPGLFWSAFNLASATNIGRDEPWLITWLPKVEVLIARVEELNEKYQFASPLTVYGAYWASRTRIFGGRPELGKSYFERAIKHHPNFLLHKLMYARTYAIQTQNRELYQKLLGEVLEAKPDVVEKQRLSNLIAQERAQRYLTETEDLFLDDEPPEEENSPGPGPRPAEAEKRPAADPSTGEVASQKEAR